MAYSKAPESATESPVAITEAPTAITAAPVDSVYTQVPEAGAAAMPLDGFTTAPLFATSDWRRLLTTYTGPLNRVRKSTGGDVVTEHDVPYAAGTNLLDDADRAAFVGSETWRVVTRYDQTAGARNVTQATGANQPHGGIAGVANKIATRDAALFDAANGGRLQRADSLGLSGGVALTVFLDIQAATAAAFRYIASFGTAATNTMIGIAVNALATQVWVGCVTAERVFTVSSLTAAPSKLVMVLGAGAQWDTIALYQNGAACSVASDVAGTTLLNLANTAFNHGANPPGTGAFFDGSMAECVVWNAALEGAELTAALAL